MSDIKFDDLVGKTILDARYDGDHIYLNLNDGSCVSMIPYGDCCAHCYIQHVDGADALVNAVVKQVETLECHPTQVEIDNADTLDAWGHRLITDKGYFTIEMRVNHNGYYGGSLDLTLGDCHSQAKVLEDF